MASSRLRWATRIENVLMIRNDPTNRAMPAKTSRKMLMKLSLVDAGGGLLGHRRPGHGLEAGRQLGLDRLGQVLGAGAVPGGYPGVAVRVLPAEEELLGGAGVEERQGGPDRAALELGDAHEARRDDRLRAARDELDRVADLVAGASGRAGV
jgi:hypothetical protein